MDQYFGLPYIDHAEFFHQVPDDILADMLPVAKKVALAIGLADGQYNLLQVSREKDRLDKKFNSKPFIQNNGRMAHQVHACYTFL